VFPAYGAAVLNVPTVVPAGWFSGIEGVGKRNLRWGKVGPSDEGNDAQMPAARRQRENWWTFTGVCGARKSVAEVIHGVTEAAVKLVRLNV